MKMRWRTAAIGQVAVLASGTNSAETVWTWSAWLIQTSISLGSPERRSEPSVIRTLARPYSRAVALPTFPPSSLQASCMP